MVTCVIENSKTKEFITKTDVVTCPYDMESDPFSGKNSIVLF